MKPVVLIYDKGPQMKKKTQMQAWQFMAKVKT